MSRASRSGVLVLATGFFLAAGCDRERSAPLDFGDVKPIEPKATMVVPTLDTPVEAGKSAVWCATFQLAWSRLARNALREPPIVRGAEELSKRLNSASFSEANLPEGTFYAAAGWMRDGTADWIRKEMAAKFPAASPPDLGVTSETLAVAYAYLQVRLKFKDTFFDNLEPLHFTDSTGKKTAVKSFGLRRVDAGTQFDLRDQMAVLYQQGDRERGPEEFIIDPSKGSDPIQLVLACIPQEETLERTIEAAEGRIAGPKPWRVDFLTLGPYDVFLVPNLEFKLQHRFSELEGRDKTFLNEGFETLWIDGAPRRFSFGSTTAAPSWSPRPI